MLTDLPILSLTNPSLTDLKRCVATPLAIDFLVVIRANPGTSVAFRPLLWLRKYKDSNLDQWFWRPPHYHCAILTFRPSFRTVSYSYHGVNMYYTAHASIANQVIQNPTVRNSISVSW